ncbi:Ubiquitin-like modifier-activating enzyme ATG7 [Beauveria bassiana]|uniref:Ubiquitin-like modifier-activating enzyme ATG7 n=1 Tax=Beauveria bassiana TaxID=176275 RepID=A0A2N6NWJ6_BEABA|nr:Ubiquitin-like modifier-activating enzyme ATG7 [Beauveria bassiana]
MATPLQFAPFASEIELPFYSALFASKLDYDKLDDSARGVLGLYEPRVEQPEASSKMQILGNALTSKNAPLGTARAEGIIRNVNTLEDFKNMDKTAMLKTAGRQVRYVVATYCSTTDVHKIWDAINDGTIYSVPSLLSSFVILSYADLKKYKFTYWFAFPALHSDPAWRRSGPSERLTPDETTALVDRVGTWRYSVDGREHGFFLAKKVHGPESEDHDEYADEAEEMEPDTEAETAASKLAYHWNVGSLRRFEEGFFNNVAEEDRYICFVDSSTHDEGPSWPLRNLLVLIRQRFRQTRVKILCYRDTRARRHEARSVVLPLEMDAVSSIEMAEMPKITFVDYGRVSYSNPVRQPLFEFEDCVGGGKPKAEAAAAMLRRIYPGVDAQGHSLAVPMLGHPFTDESRTKADLDRLKTLIDEHDVIFLLMDTRESRWLPTVMGKAAGKIVMNAALGFDSYVVMRHGAETMQEGHLPLGCYFCNDVVAPADSMKDQTLDQQCTVTRPGVAAIASALLVEMLTSLLQHPLRNAAPAPQHPPSSAERDPPTHPLGLVPHQIRGYVSTFTSLVIRGQSYDCCSACSPKVLAAYRADGWQFLRRALQEKDYVAELSGLAEVQRRAEEMAGELDWDDEDEGLGGR